MLIVLDEAYRQAASGRFPGHELRFYPPTLADFDIFSGMLADADVLGMRRVLPLHLDAHLFGTAKRLSFVHKSGSGADHFDTEALSGLGILLALNSGFNAVSVAEHAVVLILACVRRTFDYARLMDSGKWAFFLAGEEPMMISGKTVGLIGIGAIGARVARAMIGLDAKVICYHPDPTRSGPPGVARVDLDTLLTTSDVVSLQVPMTPATAGMIGPREIALMKPTAVLINVSRGGIVDQKALVGALRERRIWGAGLDVFEEEPLPPDHPLRTLPNVVVTPHIAGVVKEVAAMQVEGTLSNIELFLAGRRPERLVNPEILRDGRARARHLLERSS